MVSLYIGLFASGKDGSRVLLEHACRDHNIDNILTHDSLGKPLLPGGVEVSISHAAGAAAVVISDRPVGVDIEQIRTVRKNLPARTSRIPKRNGVCPGKRSLDAEGQSAAF